MTGSDLYAEAAALTTHALDIAIGGPAANLPISLYVRSGGAWTPVTQTRTNAFGRCDAPLLTFADAKLGTYLLEFDARSYHGVTSSPFGVVPVEFTIMDQTAHYHVPIVFAPGGYSTYRGAPPTRPPNDFGSWHVSNPRGRACPTPANHPNQDQGAGLTIHAIDIAQGQGAANLHGRLYYGSCLSLDAREAGPPFVVNAEGRTDQYLVEPGMLRVGTYELLFDVGRYFSGIGFGVGPTPFLEHVRIRIHVADTSQHFHIPLLLSPWGYSCYQGN